MTDAIYIGGFSGGIDSQAAARFMLNRYGAERVVLVNTDAGGNENRVTVEHIAWYSENVHSVTKVDAIVSDLWKTPGHAETRGLDGNAVMKFDDMAAIKGRFPSKSRQFCTVFLKLHPVRRFMNQTYPEGNYERFSGVRRDESEGRATTAFRQWDDFFDCYVNHPIADWTKQMAFDYVRAHGELVNPLYALGFERVGCAPCVNSGKDDILNWSKRFPEEIDKIRAWEKRVGRTFFPPKVPGMKMNWVDDMVEWAKTDHGGRQPNIFRVLNEPASCESKFGLCE